MSYPFRFYGARPGDWFEGASCGHFFEVQFETAPDAAARTRIAHAFERAAAGSWIQSDCEAWLWAGDWALLAVGEKSDGSEERDFFEDVQGAFRAVHEACAIAEVHYGGTREPNARDGWSTWSTQQKPAPGPAPEWPGLDLNADVYGGRIERRSIAVAEDAAFEAERARARETP
jgi:hypothetical protein